MRMLRFGLIAGLLAACVAPAAAQERFDLRDWARKPIEESTAAFFNCRDGKACGAGSSVSARLTALPKEPWTVARLRTREEAIVKRMKEQGGDRVKNVEIVDVKDAKVEGLALVYGEKRITLANNQARTTVSGVMTGKTKSYVIVSSGRTPETARNNFNGYARVVALILEQMAQEPANADAASKDE